MKDHQVTRRTFEFAVERTETVTIRRTQKTFVVWCGDCDPTARMLKPEDAALATRISIRQIYARIEAGTVHFSESANGLLVCINSLAQGPPAA